MGRGDGQATIKTSRPETSRCTYKLNPGNGRTVIVHMGDGEANATVDGTHFNVRSLWQLYQLLRLLV